MKRSRMILLALFTIIVTLIAIYLNWSKFLMGDSATIFNLTVSIGYLSSWFIFSFYWGIKQEGTYKKFIIMYWGTNFIYFIILAISTNIASLLLPLAIWFGGPTYGFGYLISSPTTLYITIASLGLIVSASAYGIGTNMSKK